ncbi:related to OTU domain-containing protein 6B [Cephalotrichum gorgonifer]|uniref:Related to OTU domain-containing protein 6B n=1 Tax=Cephalotrichum gorgonifer TaxID=2041049 RepID=A0AAE8MR33_9PEZI|nr:related to OTU domain-containing protein 6B [Cephalotrichum gorgonifer]
MAGDATTESPRPGTQGETLEEMQARHRKEKKELQARVTGKKKNATKKTRKGVNDECADMERRLAEKQAGEIASLLGSGPGQDDEETIDGDDEGQQAGEGKAEAVARDIGDLKLGAPQEQAPASAQGQGKKRNRQKERLARRQAEQIAAAEAAESEALSMTDHRAIERAAMAYTFKTNSLVEREIRPDGHCLFSAVADQLEHRGIPLRSAPGAAQGDGTPGFKVVRGVAARWVEDRGDDFAPFLEEDLGDYVARIRDTAEWGGQIELQALAGAYNLEINVVQNGATEKIQAAEGGGGREGEVERIWLAYYRHGYGLGEHYNSLRTAPS